MRSGLCSDLRFSEKDRDENIRRVTEVAKFFADAGSVAICSFVSPFKTHRDFPRQVHETSDLAFFEVFVDTPLTECERRDTKGLYKKARAGELPGFTGIDQPYERPDNPELVVKTTTNGEGDSVNLPVRDCVQKVLDMLAASDIVSPELARDVGEWFDEKEKAAAEKEGSPSEVKTKAPRLVHELFVSGERKEAAIREAESMTSVEISKVDLQWLQVSNKNTCSQKCIIPFHDVCICKCTDYSILY